MPAQPAVNGVSVPRRAQQTTMIPALTFVLVFMGASFPCHGRKARSTSITPPHVIGPGLVLRPFHQHKGFSPGG